VKVEVEVEEATARKREFDSSSREDELAIARLACLEGMRTGRDRLLLVVKLIAYDAIRDSTKKPSGRMAG